MKLTLLFTVLMLSTFQCLKGQELLEVAVLDSFSVSFDFGSAVVKQKQELVQRFNKIKQSKYGRVVLRGYTDTVSSVEFNTKLASERMQFVQKCVQSSTLKGLRIDTFNLNEQRFETATHDSLFRRVEVIVYDFIPKFTFNEPVNLHINFEPAKDIMLLNSTRSVNKLVTIMQFDTTLHVKLNGHVCCDNDQSLSERRALRVKEYLVNRGISSKRITCEGFSNRVPVAEEWDQEGMAMNRRVEVVFIKPEKNRE